MEIVSIEKKTFEELVAKFDRFVRRMDAICHRHGEKKMSEWMDNQDVCRMTNIADASGQRDFGIQPNKPQDLLSSRRCAAHRLHRGGQAKGSTIQR